MKILLDTHAIIWYVEQSDQLPASCVSLIESEDAEVYFSSASLHEMAVKIAIGKLGATKSLEDIADYLLDMGFGYLPVLPRHARYLAEQMKIVSRGNHGDPFDRIMVAQAIVEGMHFMTKDEVIPIYSPPLQTIWEQSNEEFWEMVDVAAIKNVSQPDIPLFQNLTKGMMQLMMRYGIISLRPSIFRKGDSFIFVDDSGKIRIVGFKIKYHEDKPYLESLEYFGVNGIDELKKLTVQQRVEQCFSGFLSLFNDLGVSAIIAKEGESIVGWLTPSELPKGKTESSFLLNKFGIVKRRPGLARLIQDRFG